MSFAINGMSSAFGRIAETAAGAGGPKGIASTGSAPFADLMKDSITTVDGLQEDAQKAISGLITGTGVDVHQAMVATQKASMGFELALAVRNKAVAAYQQVMGMQF